MMQTMLNKNMKKIIWYTVGIFQILVGLANLFLGWFNLSNPDYGRVSFGTICFIFAIICFANAKFQDY